MSFLPEDDVDFLARKGFVHELKSEKLPDGTERNGIVFPGYSFQGNLRARDKQLQPCSACDLLILIPSQYATARLDNFYTIPFLKRPNNTDPQNATGENDLFQRRWQFWSRHLAKEDWRVGIDGLETFLQYVNLEFRKA
jgi:hypothetical protein